MTKTKSDDKQKRTTNPVRWCAHIKHPAFDAIFDVLPPAWWPTRNQEDDGSGTAAVPILIGPEFARRPEANKWLETNGVPDYTYDLCRMTERGAQVIAQTRIVFGRKDK